MLEGGLLNSSGCEEIHPVLLLEDRLACLIPGGTTLEACQWSLRWIYSPALSSGSSVATLISLEISIPLAGFLLDDKHNLSHNGDFQLISLRKSSNFFQSYISQCISWFLPCPTHIEFYVQSTDFLFT